MPNHQLVENYIVFSEMESAKKSDVPEAKRCRDLSNHEIFEKVLFLLAWHDVCLLFIHSSLYQFLSKLVANC
jgi:hypothetical protein